MEAVDGGLIIPEILIVNVWAPIIEVLELRLVIVIILLVVSIEQVPDVAKFVPESVAQEVGTLDKTIELGKVILNFPADDIGSFVVTVKVIEDKEFTIVGAFKVETPDKVLAAGIIVAVALCFGNPFFTIYKIKAEVVSVDGGAVYIPTVNIIWVPAVAVVVPPFI